MYESNTVPPPINPEDKKTHVSQSVAVIFPPRRKPPDATKTHRPKPTFRPSWRSKRAKSLCMGYPEPNHILSFVVVHITMDMARIDANPPKSSPAQGPNHFLPFVLASGGAKVNSKSFHVGRLACPTSRRVLFWCSRPRRNHNRETAQVACHVKAVH